MALADFVVEGHFARHLRRMRLLYARRREAQAPEAGMHLVGWLPSGVADAQIEQRASQKGIEAVALSSMSREPMHRGGLVPGYAGCSEQDIQAGVHILARILREME